MKTRKNNKQDGDPAVRSTGLLAGMSSAQLNCEALRRKIESAREQIAALETQLAQMRMRQASREKELACQQARLPANTELRHGAIIPNV